jgi:hypothetical protein
LPVQVEWPEQLPRPAEFEALTAAAIIDGLISGRNPADWSLKRANAKKKRAAGVGGDVDSLTAVKTEGYVLYRVRRLGRALSVLGERLQSAAHSRQAIRYRLFDDPFGPAPLAQALVDEANAASGQEADGVGRSAVLFGLCEIELVVANAWTRIRAGQKRATADLGPLFNEVLQRLQSLQDAAESGTPQDVQKYKSAVRGESKRLLTAKSVGGPAYAG